MIVLEREDLEPELVYILERAPHTSRLTCDECRSYVALVPGRQRAQAAQFWEAHVECIRAGRARDRNRTTC